MSVDSPALELTARPRVKPKGRVKIRDRVRVEVRVRVSISVSLNKNNSGADELTELTRNFSLQISDASCSARQQQINFQSYF